MKVLLSQCLKIIILVSLFTVHCSLFTVPCSRAELPELVIGGVVPAALQNKYYYFKPYIRNDMGELVFSIENKPVWAEFDNATGELNSINNPDGPVYPLNEHVKTYSNIKITVSEASTGRSNVLGPFSIIVENKNDAPVFVDDSVPQIKEDQPYILSATIRDDDILLNIGEYLSIKLIDPPPWLPAEPVSVTEPVNGQVTATFQGTPTDETAVTYYLQISAVDSQGIRTLSPMRERTVETVNDPPLISGTPALTAKEDALYTFKPNISDVDNIDLEVSFSINGEPPAEGFWLKVEGNALTGIPKHDAENDDIGIIKNIVVSVSDGEHKTSLNGFNLLVENSNDNPSVKLREGQTISSSVLQGGTWQIEVEASDIDLLLAGREGIFIEDELKYFVVNQPGWMEILPDPANADNAILRNKSGRPDNDDVGIYSDIEIVVVDGLEGIARLEKFSITVENANDQPFFIQKPAPVVTVNEDEAVSFIPVIARAGETNIIKAGDIDIPYGDRLYFSLARTQDAESQEVPAWLGIISISSTEAKLTGVPGNSDVGVYKGIEIKVKDRAGAEPDVSCVFDIHVINVNDPPVFVQTPPNDPLNPIELNENTNFSAVSPIISAQDEDEGDAVTFRLETSPPAEWLLVKTESSSEPKVFNGKFSGTPGDADVGTYTVNVIAEDNSGEAISTTFYVKVNNVNIGPRITTDLSATLTAKEDELFTKIIVSQDRDTAYGDELTYTLSENAPSWLNMRKNSEDQSLEIWGTPLAANIGITKNIIITVKDTEGAPDSRIFNLEVIAVNDPPIISGTLPFAYVGQDFYFKPDASDEEGDELFFTLTIYPEADWLKINPVTGELSGKPLVRKGYQLTIKVIDENDGAAELGPMILNVITAPGDLDFNGSVDLADAITVLQILSGIKPSVSLSISADVNADGLIGMENAIYILKTLADK